MYESLSVLITIICLNNPAVNNTCGVQASKPQATLLLCLSININIKYKPENIVQNKETKTWTAGNKMRNDRAVGTFKARSRS